jgi:hypothetical protein
MADRNSVTVAWHKVHDETVKSIVMTITMPGGGNVQKVVRVPKALCRGWTNTHVNIYAGYFSNGVTEVNLLRRATTDEFDAPGDTDVLRMPLRYTVEHKLWIVDEVMTAYADYERLGVRG